MKITSIKVTPVNIPLEVPYIWSVGTYPGTTQVVVEVMTDEGLTGLGEAPSIDCAQVIEKQLAPKLNNVEVFDIAECERRCLPDAKVDTNTADQFVLIRAFGAIEIALWDLRGKAWGLPLYKILGGAVRKEISFTEYFAFRENRGNTGGESTPGEVAAYCAKMRDLHGSTLFEGKCTPADPKTAVKLVKEIRGAIGDDATLRLDANMGFTLSAARHVLSGIEPYNIDNIEDPVAGFYGMAKLRQHSRIPFSSHVPDLRLAAQLGVPDNFVINIAALGGISRTLKFIAVCEMLGLGFWFYSGQTGIATAAYLHLAAATQHLYQPSQSLFRWQIDDVTEEGPFKPKNNILTVPESPGLGVTLSKPDMKRCHERFLEEGTYDQYYNPANPGTYVHLPL